MEIILKKDVENLGFADDLVTVKDGYGRNFLIPQGIAYALIAGLPPIYGLYCALVPQVIYAIFGSARQVAIGPVAMDSLIVATGVTSRMGLVLIGNSQRCLITHLREIPSNIKWFSMGQARKNLAVEYFKELTRLRILSTHLEK